MFVNYTTMFPQSVLDWNITLGHVASSRFSPTRSKLRNLVCDRTVLLQVSVNAVVWKEIIIKNYVI